MNLSHLAGPDKGVFVELTYDIHANEIVRVRAFTSPRPLANYAACVQLPDMG